VHVHQLQAAPGYVLFLALLQCQWLSALAGAETSLAFTLVYAAPEVVAAFENPELSCTACPAADVWSFGVIALKMLTGESAFHPFATRDEIQDSITGRSKLSWEGSRRDELLPRLRIFQRTVLDCLQRDPGVRPQVLEVVRALEDLFTSTVPSSGVGPAQAGRIDPEE
jgi:serine/threonine protein kinase